MPKRAGIIQSNYIPWKGYFDFIASVDEFILFDDVQYTRRDWRNRNQIKTKDGLQWLTVPVEVKGKYFQPVNQTRVSNHDWVDEHLAKLHHAYARAPHYEAEAGWVRDLYEAARAMTHLSRINEHFIRGICRRLEIQTPIRRSDEFAIVEGKNERLISLCAQTGATEYLSGPAARSYMDETVWRDNGIEVFYKSYDGYEPYPQLHGEFAHAVTILDLIFNTGDAARNLFRAHDVRIHT